MAECQISDAKLEEAILKKPEFRGSANRQNVRDLRSLRDAAFTLWSYGRHAECERLVTTIRELVNGPPMGNLGAMTRMKPTSRSRRASPRFVGARRPVIAMKRTPRRLSQLTRSRRA